MKVFYDVDTQNDFMNKDGALYVPDAELIKPNLKLLTEYARKNFIPVVGSVDKHFGIPEYKEREGELVIWGGVFPNHCMNETRGQLKIKETTLEPAPNPIAADWFTQNNNDFGGYFANPLIERITKQEVIRRWKERQAIPSKQELKEAYKRITTGILDDEINKAVKELQNTKIRKTKTKGVFFEKQSYDVFTNPNTEELLKRADVKEAVVYGVATDFCVKAAVLGMQNRGIQCYVVEDAIKGVFPDKTKAALEEMIQVGAKLVTVRQVLEGLI